VLKKLGIPEVVMLLVALLFIFGPARLPGFGKALGDAVRAFRGAVKRTPEGKDRSRRDL